MKTVTVPVKGLNFAGCGREIEKRLGKLAPIRAVEASYVSQTATITYDEDRMTEAQLRKLVEDCGYACGEPLSPGTRPSTTAERGGTSTHQEDGKPAPGAAHPEQTVPPVPMKMQEAVEQGPAGAAHAMADRGPMDHDMSDPAMAREMEADMRMRFVVSLVLTIPIILYSSLGTTLFHLHLPTPFGVSPNWVLLVLSTPVVWWCGWTFHFGAWRALRNRTLDMNVLVSLGVLVAYLFSGDGSLVPVQQLWTYQVATGERRQLTDAGADAAAPDRPFSLDEQLRRERRRVRDLGVTDYQFAAGEDGTPVLLVPLGEALTIARGDGPNPEPIDVSQSLRGCVLRCEQSSETVEGQPLNSETCSAAKRDRPYQVIGGFLRRFGPHGLGLKLAGLYDAAEEGDFQRGLEQAGLGSNLTRAEMERLGFYACMADLEDELIRALGADAVEAVIDAQGDLGSFRTCQKQPAWRGGTHEEQLRRFLGTHSGRKIRSAALLVEALDLTRRRRADPSRPSRYPSERVERRVRR